MGTQPKPLIKSTTFWFQVFTVIGILFTQYASLGLVHVALAGAVTFACNVIIQKFFSKGPGNIQNSSTFTWINVSAAILMLTDYFLENKLFSFFGDKTAMIIGIGVATINTFLRMQYLSAASDNEGK